MALETCVCCGSRLRCIKEFKSKRYAYFSQKCPACGAQYTKAVPLEDL